MVVTLEFPLDYLTHETSDHLKSIMSRHPGDVPVVLYVTGEEMFTLTANDGFWIDGSPESLEEFRDTLGADMVATVDGLEAVR